MGALGVDISVPVSAAQWSCLMAANVTWAAVRGWHSTGTRDQNAPASLAAAAAAGMRDVDVYLFPCRALPAGLQASALIAGLAPKSYATVWLDIEHNPSSTHAARENCSWAAHDAPSNCEYVRALADAVAAYGVGVGIYSSHHSWLPIVGASCTALSRLPLWYPHYDRRAACDDYSKYAFGGWTSPRWKQFTDRAGTDPIGACGLPLDTSVSCS
jgi:hypothetical protein